MAMVFENMKHNTARKFWLFDTFEGLPEPTSDKDDAQAKDYFKQIKDGSETSAPHVEDGKWCDGPLNIVLNNMMYTGYPESNFHFIKGKVEDTLPVVNLPEKISILRLDTDWYDSTKAELEYLYMNVCSQVGS